MDNIQPITLSDEKREYIIEKLNEIIIKLDIIIEKVK